MKKQKGEKRNLFFCETLFCLYNMLLIRLTAEKGIPADIVFTDATDFSEIAAHIKETGLFENVYQIETKKRITDLWLLPKAERLYHAQKPHPKNYMPEIKGLAPFTDFWVNLDNMCPKMFYYAMLSRGMRAPDVHFVEEGNGTYFVDFSVTRKDFIPHEKFYGDDAFMEHCVDLWLYDTDLYTGESEKELILKSLDKRTVTTRTFKDLILNVFGNEPLPKQKYIFFEEPVYADGHYTNDLEMVEQLAHIVGKENLIIKLHPRDDIDRFTPFGYHVVKNSKILWEAMILNNDLTNKVFLTFGSTSAFASIKIFGETPPVIILEKLEICRYPYRNDPSNIIFRSKLYPYYNKNKTNIFVPATAEELKTTIRYIDYLQRVKEENE